MCCDHVKVSAQVLFVRKYSALHGPCDRLISRSPSNCAQLLFCFSSVRVEIVLVNTSAPGFCFHGLRHWTPGGLALLCTFYSRCCWTSWYRVCVCARARMSALKSLRQGCASPFSGPGAVRAALPQRLDERATHSRVKAKRQYLWCARRTAYCAPPSQHTQPLALGRIPAARILILHVCFLLKRQPVLTSGRATCRPLGLGSAVACL